MGQGAGCCQEARAKIAAFLLPSLGDTNNPAAVLVGATGPCTAGGRPVVFGEVPVLKTVLKPVIHHNLCV